MGAIFYTDGACSYNGKEHNEGGWSYVELIKNKNGYETKVVTGNKKDTTNNEMELTAVFKALVKAYKDKKKQVTIYSDSAYVVNAITKNWLKKWNSNNWKTVEGKSVKNKKIWEKMYKLLYTKGLSVKLIKVKGHEDNPLNELADKMAVEARKRLI